MSAMLFLSALTFAQEPQLVDPTSPAPTASESSDAAEPSTSVEPVASDDPRFVEGIVVKIETESPRRQATRIRAAIESAGGTLARYQEENDADWGDSVYLEAWVPVQNWPAVESKLGLGPNDSLDRERIPKSNQSGEGPPHIDLAIDLSTPAAPEPNFLVGASGGLLLPADRTGPGMAQLYGMRIMDTDRESSLEVTYGPAAGILSEPNAPWMLQITAGSAMYSDYMGSGERAVFNPYIGGHLGYAYRGESWFVLQGEVGLELLHINHVILDVYARPTGHFRKGAVGLSVETGAGLVFPF